MALLRILVIVLLTLAVPVATTASVLAPHAMPAMQMSVQPHDTATTQNSMSDGHCATDSADTKSSPHSSGSKPCKPSAACKLCHSFPSPQAVSWQPSWTIQPHLLLLTDTAVSTRDPSGLWRPPRSL